MTDSQSSTANAELIAAYDEYIGLLVQSESSMLGLAHAHGYRCPDELVQRGKELREKIAELKSGAPAQGTRSPHKVMTHEEYAAMPIIGWHEVCRDVDGFGAIGIRFLGETSAVPSTEHNPPAPESSR